MTDQQDAGSHSEPTPPAPEPMPESRSQEVLSKESMSRRRVVLRIVTGVLLAAAMIAGWSVMGRQKARKQTEAIKAVAAAGGQVYLDYQWNDGHLLPDGQPQQAAWLRRLLGPENLDRAVAVDLREAVRPGDLIAKLPLMPHLVDLDVSGTQLDDDALSRICSLSAMTRLDLASTAVTDNGVRQLRRLRQLTTLSLASTKVTDQSVETLGKLKRLKKLDLANTPVTAEGITRLRKLLPKCQITQP